MPIKTLIRKTISLQGSCIEPVDRFSFGIGDILALTIMLEVDDINRFHKVNNFRSYCRYAPSQRLSDGKTKGQVNRKNRNRYLSWAFTEAAHLGRRYNQRFSEY